MTARQAAAGLLAFVTFLILPAVADATCIRRKLEDGVYDCCSPPGGPLTCVRITDGKRFIQTYGDGDHGDGDQGGGDDRSRGDGSSDVDRDPPPPPDPKDRWRAPTSRPPKRSSLSLGPASWDAYAGDGAFVEARLGGFGGYLVPEEGLDGGGGAGGELGLGVRWSSRFSKRSPVDDMGFEAVFAILGTMGLIALPSDAWLGSELGVEVRARGPITPLGDGLNRSVQVGLSPALHVCPRDSRWRFPSVLGFLAPELGVALFQDGPSALTLRLMRASADLLVTPRLGLSLEMGPWILIPLGSDDSAQMLVTGSLAIVVR
jgi:hypothetical protein